MSNTQSHLIVTEEGIKIYKDDPASAILCEDQQHAKDIIKSKFGHDLDQMTINTKGYIYPVPGIEFEKINIPNPVYSSSVTAVEPSVELRHKTVARLIEHTAEKESPEIDKELLGSNPAFKPNVIEAWKESMNAAIKDAIEQQEQGEGNTEVHYSGYEEAIRYAIEMMDKHIANP